MLKKKEILEIVIFFFCHRIIVGILYNYDDVSILKHKIVFGLFDIYVIKHRAVYLYLALHLSNCSCPSFSTIRFSRVYCSVYQFSVYHPVYCTIHHTVYNTVCHTRYCTI